MKEIAVLVVDDQRLVREGIASLLALQEGIRVTGTAENGREALIAARKDSPDVVLMDIRMPILDGIAATKRLIEEQPETRILMLTTFDDEEYIMKSLKAGAIGYIMKDIPIDDLAQAIRTAIGGSGVLSPGVLGSIVSQLNQEGSPHIPGNGGNNQAIWNSLNPKEQEILKCLALGRTNREIAEDVCLTEGTVKNYISSILTALDLRDRTQAALMALKNGWVRETEA